MIIIDCTFEMFIVSSFSFSGVAVYHVHVTLWDKCCCSSFTRQGSGRSQDFTLGAQKLRAEGAEGMRIGERVSPPQPTRGLGSVVSSPSRPPTHFWHIWGPQNTLASVFFRKKIHSIDNWGHGPSAPPPAKAADRLSILLEFQDCSCVTHMICRSVGITHNVTFTFIHLQYLRVEIEYRVYLHLFAVADHLVLEGEKFVLFIW